MSPFHIPITLMLFEAHAQDILFDFVFSKSLREGVFTYLKCPPSPVMQQQEGPTDRSAIMVTLVMVYLNGTKRRSMINSVVSNTITQSFGNIGMRHLLVIWNNQIADKNVLYLFYLLCYQIPHKNMIVVFNLSTFWDSLQSQIQNTLKREA